MSRTVTCLAMFVLIINCGSRYKPTTQSLVGEYSDKHIAVIKQYYLKYICNEVITLGNSLSLRADSTYTYSSCNMVINGIWSIKSDSLNLTCLDIKWKSDSMNLANPVNCPKEPSMIYITNETEIKDRFKVNVNNKIMHATTWLSKVE